MEPSTGVLTIVEGLGTSDLVVAVMNRQGELLDKRDTSKPRLAAGKPFSSLKSSAQTSTHHLQDICNRQVQSEDRYASSYQVAHCNINLTAPYTPISEFPPQRAQPSINEGNFQIGGQASCHDVEPSIIANHFRGGLTWPDRGSVCCNKSPREMEAFANSLRKYPSSSPDRSISTELVARLLKYTQAKHSQKTARMKSMRFLRNNFTSDRRSSRKLAREIDMHTRVQEVIKDRTEEINSTRKRSRSRSRRDNGTDVRDDVPGGVQREYKSTGRSFRLRSETKGGNSRTTYDYLRASQSPGSRRQPSPSRKQQQQEDISREVRSVIRQMYHNEPVVFQVCPKIQKRLIQHKKTCPVRNENGENMSAEKQDEACKAPCRTSDELMPKLLRLLETISDREACSSTPADKRNGECKERLSTLFEAIFNCQEPTHSKLDKYKQSKEQKLCCPCTKTCSGYDSKLQTTPYFCNAVNKSTETNVDCFYKPEGKSVVNSADKLLSERKSNVDCTCKILPKCKSAVNSGDKLLTERKSNIDCVCKLQPEGKSDVNCACKSRPKGKGIVDSAYKLLFERKSDVDCACKLRFKCKSTVKSADKLLPKKKSNVDCFCKLQPEGKSDVDCACKIRPKGKGIVDSAHELLFERKSNVDCTCKLQPEGKSDVDCACKLRAKSKSDVDCACKLQPKGKGIEDSAYELLFERKSNVDSTCKLQPEGKSVFDCACKLRPKGKNEFDCACKLQPKGKGIVDSAYKLLFETKSNVDCVCKLQPKDKSDVDCACKLRPKGKGVVDSDHKLLFERKSNADCVCKLQPKAKSDIDCACDLLPKGKIDVNCACVPQSRCKHFCECGPLSDEEYYRHRIDEEVAKWFSEVPVQANEFSQNKHRREDMVRVLADIIKQLPNNNDFESNARNAIEKCVNNMPMWKPGSKQVDEQLRSQLINDLLHRIMDIPRHPDKLRDTVRRFLEDLNFRGNVNIIDITDNIANKLKKLVVNAPKDVNEFENQITSEIAETLAELPIKFGGDKKLESNGLARSLARKVIDLLRNTTDKNTNLSTDENTNKNTNLSTDENTNKNTNISIDENTNLKSKFEKNITNWLDEVGKIVDVPVSGKSENMIKDLASKLDKIQSPGINATVRNNMEREINVVLKNLDVPVGKTDYFTDNLMEKITDTIHANDKEKIERKQEQEAMGEINDWLKNLQGVDALNPIEKDKLSKEIAAKTMNAIENDDKSNRDAIKDTLTRAGIKMSSSSLGKQLDKVKSKLKKLPDKVQKDDLKESTRIHFNKAIDESDIPEQKKAEVKDKFGDVLAEKMEASIVTKKDMDNFKKSLLDVTDAIIDDTHISKSVKNELKEKLDAILDKNFDKLLSTKDKDSAKYMTLKEINYVIDKEPIPDEEKDDLKYKLKNMLTENLNKPYSTYNLETINDDIGDIIEEAELEKDVKHNLVNKLTKITKDNLNELPKQSTKEHVKNKTSKSINSVVDTATLPDDVKEDLKQKLNNMLNDNFDQPYSDQVKNVVLDNMNKIIDDSWIPKSDKDNLIEKLTNVVGKKLDELPHQTAVDHTKELIINDLNDLMDDIGLPRQQITDLSKNLGRTLAEFLDRPFGYDQRNKLIETVKDNIEKSDIPSDKKGVLLNKVEDFISRKIDEVPNQTPEKFAKDSAHREIMRVMNEMQGSNDEKNENELAKFEDVIEKSFRNMYLSEIRDALQEGISDTFRKNSSLPPDKQMDVMNEVRATLSRILDESFHEDHAREYLNNINNMIQKAPIQEENKTALKRRVKKIVDDHSRNPDFSDVIDVIKEGLRLINVSSNQSLAMPKTDETAITELVKAIDESPIPSDKKDLLLTKLNTLVPNSNKPIDLGKVSKELESTVNELPISLDEKHGLKAKLATVVNTGANIAPNKLKSALLKDIGAAIDQESLSQDKKDYLKYELENLVGDPDEPLSDKVKVRIKEGAYKLIIEIVFSGDKNNRVCKNINCLVDSLPTQPSEGNITKEKMIARTNLAIDDAPIRQHLKKDLKSQLKSVISDIFKQPSLLHRKAVMNKGVNNIINKLPLTGYQKNDLKRKLVDIMTKELDRMPKSSDDDINSILKDIKNVVEEEPIAKYKKTELMDKLRKAMSISFEPIPSDDAKNKMTRSLLEAIDDTVIPNDQKTELKAKIENVVTKYFEPLPRHEDTKYAPIDELKITGLEAMEVPPNKSKISYQKDKFINETPILGDKGAASIDDAAIKDKGSLLHSDSDWGGIDSHVDQLHIPEDKKMRMKEKIKKMAQAKPQQPKRVIEDGNNKKYREFPILIDKKSETTIVTLSKILDKVDKLQIPDDEKENIRTKVHEKLAPIKSRMMLAKQSHNQITDTSQSTQKRVRKKGTISPISSKKDAKIRDKLTEKVIKNTDFASEPSSDIQMKNKNTTLENSNTDPKRILQTPTAKNMKLQNKNLL